MGRREHHAVESEAEVHRGGDDELPARLQERAGLNLEGDARRDTAAQVLAALGAPRHVKRGQEADADRDSRGRASLFALLVQ